LQTGINGPFSTSGSSGLLISSKAFGKPLVEPKTLGWEHSKDFLKNVIENLGVVPTPLKCFQNWFWTNGDDYGV
jgi:hypothetical protein